MPEVTHPPLRLLVSSAEPISDRQARKNIDAFLRDYAQRPSGMDATIKTRLEKVSAALKDGSQTLKS